jgi:hypothetical protein
VDSLLQGNDRHGGFVILREVAESAVFMAQGLVWFFNVIMKKALPFANKKFATDVC